MLVVQQPQMVREFLSAYNGSLGPSDAMDVQRSLSGLSNMGARAGQVLSGRSASLMSMPGDNPLTPTGVPLEHRSSTMGVPVGMGAAGNLLVPLTQRSTSMFGSLNGNGLRPMAQVSTEFVCCNHDNEVVNGVHQFFVPLSLCELQYLVLWPYLYLSLLLLCTAELFEGRICVCA